MSSTPARKPTAKPAEKRSECLEVGSHNSQKTVFVLLTTPFADTSHNLGNLSPADFINTIVVFPEVPEQNVAAVRGAGKLGRPARHP